MSDIDIEVESKKPNIFVRVAVIVGMLLILFFIAAAIVKYVPKIISAVSPANVSLTSLFNGNGAATTTDSSSTADNSSTQSSVSSTTLTATSSTVQTKSSTQAISPTKTSAYTNYNYTYPTYYGPADLAISLVSVGQISSTGSYTQTNSIQPGSRVQMQFIVANKGSGISGSWSLNAILPTSISSERVYNSSIQPSLNPNTSYLMTLAFDAYDPSQSSIQITLTSSNDSNSSNNVLLVPLTSNGNYYNNNYTNNCYWSNGYYYCNNNSGINNTGGQSVCYGTDNIAYYCNNNSGSTNSCYWSNGNYICNNNSYNNTDLSINITNIGTMDRNTGQFYYTNYWTRNDKVAVQFTVTNNSSVSSGSYTFSASLPSSYNSSYTSPTQNSLAPGQTASFTLGFDNPNVGSQTLTVQLYPQSTDYNSSNNYASRSVYINN